MGDSTGDKLRELVTDTTDARTLGLLVEAGRIADRLDDLDRIITGKGVLELLRFRLVDHEGRVAEVKFDNVLSEARQQASALRGILAQLGVPKVEAVATVRGSKVDELRARRAARASERPTEAAGSASP